VDEITESFSTNRYDAPIIISVLFQVINMKLKALPLALLALFFAACSSDNSSTDTGSISVDITDAPVTDAAQVYLAISGITFKGPDGQVFKSLATDTEAYQQVALLELAGSASESLLSGEEMTAGEYQWMRLEVVTEGALDTYLELDDGAVYELTIPSTTGLKLNRGFTLPANGTASFTLDIDLQKSLVSDSNGYKLKPVIRILDNSEVGHITGTIDATTLSDNNCTEASIYLFSGADATPTDIDVDSGPELVAEMDTTNNEYTLGFVVAGDYTASLICDVVDDPDATDTLTFLASQNVTVTASETVTADF
jgi:uncharacterized lipoprotein YajG